MKKGKFADKAKEIIGKPKGLGDFLEGEQKVSKTVYTEEQNAGITANSKTVITDIQKYDNTEKRKIVREEFRFPEDLAETLRTYAFNHRTTKTAVVIEALSEFFKERS